MVINFVMILMPLTLYRVRYDRYVSTINLPASSIVGPSLWLPLGWGGNVNQVFNVTLIVRKNKRTNFYINVGLRMYCRLCQSFWEMRLLRLWELQLICLFQMI